MGIFSLFRREIKYEDFVKKANKYDNWFQRNKAIQIMNMAVNQPFTNREISSGFIYLGILYSKIKDYGMASDCYNKAFELVVKENFNYHPNFKKAIETFIKSGDQDRAEYWLDNLLQRQIYDKKYKKLNDFKSKINNV
ncbi:hypothetical protein [Neobacillus sp. PS3-40]|uniref:hypothetical protein n=1 Tax=Neobacillus sp. PS3-40 TaxID=3070679 RepID=UPI0027E0E1B6|nr:hypothetical protein [Neobacillus sp. PS3-40]WML45466.1 hypothetical protein RCG20_06065 [Neobacillus sp. PS3-40]